MFLELAGTSEFQDWQWDLADRLRKTLEIANTKNETEPVCVKTMIEVINATSSIQSPSFPSMKVNVEGGFLHGSLSQVKFSVGGNPTQCELADLLILGSYVENGSLAWQRTCFIQAKKGSVQKGKTPSRFDIKKDQLALLHAFPEFRGLSGIFKDKTYHLRNRTGMLGAYGFLTSPGDFTVISARILSQLLGGRASITSSDLMPAIITESVNRGTYVAMQSPLCAFHPRFLQYPNYPNDVSILTCLGLEEFVNSWTTLTLGEIWETGRDNKSDTNLKNAIVDLVSYVSKGTNELTALQELLSRTNGNDKNIPPTDNNEEVQASDKGGIGIISVIVERNLN
jgi:hypothetical protein